MEQEEVFHCHRNHKDIEFSVSVPLTGRKGEMNVSQDKNILWRNSEFC